MRFCLVASSSTPSHQHQNASSATHAFAAVLHQNIRLTVGAVWLVRAADRAARGSGGSFQNRNLQGRSRPINTRLPHFKQTRLNCLDVGSQAVKGPCRQLCLSSSRAKIQ
jgi:hypothetical protein